VAQKEAKRERDEGSLWKRSVVMALGEGDTPR